MTLRILYDYQIFEQRFGGISNSFTRHIENSRNLKDIEEIILPIKYHENIHLSEIGFVAKKQNKVIKKIIGKKRYRKFTRNSNKNLAKEALKKQDFDIFRPTYYDPYFLEFIGDKPFILDIHDMTPEIFPEFFNLKDDAYSNRRMLAKKAAKIITVSQNTKKDLMALFNIAEEKIEVIYHGNSFENLDIANLSNEETENKLPKNYILFVGNRSIYKNFYFFITAIRETLLNDEALKLVCIGSQFSQAEKIFIDNLGLLQKIIHVEIIENDHLAIVYKKAKLFAFPSLYEGFGLPIIEAFSCSCPVVASNNSSIPEIAQDAAVYFDPKNYQSIKNAIEKVLYDDGLRLELVNRGLKRLSFFSWKETIQQTINLYKNLPKSR